MPQALPVGAFVVSSVAGSAALTTTIGAAVAGAINMAIVGAVVGGLTSLVTGGDIMSGVLVGAIGGAVTGGVMGALNPTMFAAGELSAASGTTAVTSPGGWESMVAGGGDVVGSAGGATTIAPVEQAAASGLGGQMAGQLGSGLTNSFGEMLAGGVKEGAAGMLANKNAEEERAWQAEEAQKQRDAEMEALKMQLDAASSSGGSAVEKSQQLASTMAQITEERNLQKEQWQREDSAKARMRAAAKSLFRPNSEYQTGSPGVLTANEQAVLVADQQPTTFTPEDAQAVALETQELV